MYYLQVLIFKLYLPSKEEIQAGITIQSENHDSFLLYAIFMTLHNQILRRDSAKSKPT